jgi:murein DD-endopeptidase MepM/ murein hydrolase activator NlpD
MANTNTNTPLASLANTVPFGGDEAAQSYYDTTNELMKALEKRNNPNWFSIAGALAQPTKTGSAFEALGAGASELGKQQQAQEALEPSLIQMRAGLAAQKYALQNKSDAYNILKDVLGTKTTAEAQNALSTGDLSSSQLYKLANVAPFIETKDKDVGATVNNLIKNLTGVGELDIKQKAEKRLTEEQQQKLDKEALDYFNEHDKYPIWYRPKPAGTTPVAPEVKTEEPKIKPTSSIAPSSLSNLFGSNLTATSPFGPRTLNGKQETHNGIDFASTDGTKQKPIASPVDGEVISAGQVSGYGKAVLIKRADGHSVLFGHVDPAVQVGQKIKRGDVIGVIGSNMGTTTGDHVEVKVIDPKGQPINPTQYQPLTSLIGNVKLPDQSSGIQVASTDPYAGMTENQRIAAQKKETETKITSEASKENELFKSRLKDSESMTSTLKNLGSGKNVIETDVDARKLAELIANNRDVMDLLNQYGGVGQLAQAGISTPWGGFSADVNSFLEKKLPAEKQAIARQIGQLAARLNQNVMKAGKDIYGPSIAASEAVLMAKPGFQATDPSGFILSLTQKMILQNEVNGKLKEAFEDWQEKHPRELPDKFFRKSNKEYNDIMTYYHQMLRKIPDASSFYKQEKK